MSTSHHTLTLDGDLIRDMSLRVSPANTYGGTVSTHKFCVRNVQANEFACLKDEVIHAVTDLELVFTSDPALRALMRDIKLTGLISLRTLHFTFVWADREDQDTVLTVWDSLLQVVKSAPVLAMLRSVVVENPFPISILRSGWSQAARCAALRTTLYHVDKRLVDIVDSGVLQAVTVIPQRREGEATLQSQIFLDGEKARIKSLFQALAAYGMMDFQHSAD